MKDAVVFETSFEVCNKVGGIHTVVSSKAALAVQSFSEYVLIGPFFPQKSGQEYAVERPEDIPVHWRAILQRLESRGVRVVVGRWLIQGEPRVLLVDFSAIYAQKNEFKRQMWERFGVDSLNGGFEFDEPVTFSLAAGIVIEEFSKNPSYVGKKIISQTHEWMTGFTNLYLKLIGSSVKTVFTTHATMLGRSIAGNGEDVYQVIKNINPEQSARQHGVFEKFSAERACARETDVFTTVSDLTAREAKALLGRTPDVITQNGLLMNRFPSFEQASLIHATSKVRLHDFYRYYFFPYHQFDINKTLSFFISGRNEFRNKGIDVTIAALAKLNEQLKKSKSDKTIVTLFVVPMQNWGTKKELLENKLYYRHIDRMIRLSQGQMHDQLLAETLAAGLTQNGEKTKVMPIDPAFTQELQRLVKQFDRASIVAPFSTHIVGNESENEIIRAFVANGLLNRPEDCVKVILYPTYLDGSDGLLDISYYDAVNGCHLGLFASFYEPWGYTPMECAALGVPAVTATSAGFGQFIAEISSKREGIFVLDRLHKSDADIVNEYAQILFDYTNLTHHERVRHKIAAKLLAEKTDWAVLYNKYLQAYDLALSK